MVDPTQLYKEYIQGKRVIFVGPAPTLMDSERGEWIDTFDVVVRTNGSAFLIEKSDYKRDYGSRCDVLYVNVQFLREMSPLPLEKWVSDYSLKFLNAKTIRSALQDEYSKHVPVRTLQHIEVSLRSTIKGLLMGPIILTDILSFDPEYLYVTGMDFYVTKPSIFVPNDYREYYPGYLPEKICKKADIVNIGRVDSHDIYTNTRYIYYLYQQGSIDMDLDMEKGAVRVIQRGIHEVH